MFSLGFDGSRLPEGFVSSIALTRKAHARCT